MKLYGFPPSPNTWKVRATAHQIGVPLELEIVDLTKGAQRKPEYLALNPTGRTPTLVDGDFKLGESSAIMQYLGTKKKTPLWPDDAKARADIMRWQSWHLQHWSRGTNTLDLREPGQEDHEDGEPDPKALAQGTELFHQDAAVLDSHLGRHSHLVNDTLTLADFTVVAPCSMPSRRRCRWRNTATSSAGSAPRPRCRPGRRPRRSAEADPRLPCSAFSIMPMAAACTRLRRALERHRQGGRHEARTIASLCRVGRRPADGAWCWRPSGSATIRCGAARPTATTP